MKLLITTQAVDRDDPVLGFFHRWLEEFAKRCEHVTVVCLREGKHALPANVEVLSLGKEKGASRLMRISRFYRYIFSRRRKYDAVFVHMNPEYVVLGGIPWRLMGKRVGLWYTHKSVDLKLRLAARFADVILTASKESFRLATRKLRVVGHGIDTDFFAPDPNVERSTAALSVGRLMPSKRHDLAIRAAALAGKELYIAGEGPERARLELLAQNLGVSSRVHFLGALTQAQLRDEYRRAAYLIHASETGSLDKVVLEALATDMAVITTSDAFKDFPVKTAAATPEDIAAALGKTRESYDRASVVRERHSLSALIPRILSLLA